jgi:Domain of unknown function (DUF397)
VSSADQPAMSWRRSSACANGDCVEVAYLDDRVYVRGSQKPGTTLVVRRCTWARFLAQLKTEENSRPALARHAQ